MKKKFTLFIVATLSAFLLGACSAGTSSTKDQSEEKSKNTIKVSEASDNKETTEEVTKAEDLNVLELINQRLATQSVSTDELYVTGDVVVGEDSDVHPGIYDLYITGGSGNILGTRVDYSLPFINWTGGSPESGNSDYPTVIRIILFEGDKLKFSNISKIKFKAVPKDVQMTNEIGIGNYIVGRDIKSGMYKLGTNAAMDEQFQNLGWDIEILNLETGERKNQSLNPGNSDVVVNLEDGEIITTGFYNTNSSELASDQARLIFAEVKK